MNDSPLSEYERRLAARKAQERKAASQDDLFSNLRLFFFFGAVALVGLHWRCPVFSRWWLLVAPLTFIGVWVFHHRLLAQLVRARDGVAYYQLGLDRLAGQWVGRGKSGERFVEPHHPYALDLDVFGPGSLFERICTAQTSVGEAALAQWLLVPAEARVIGERQLAVQELKDRLDWREELALLGRDFRQTIALQELTDWAKAPAIAIPVAAPWIALGLTLLTSASLIYYWTQGAGKYFAWFVLFLQMAFAGAFRKRTEAILSSINTPGRDLQVLSRLLALVERESWHDPYLKELREWLQVEGLLPSAQILRLQRLIDWLDSRRNLMFAPIAFVLMWGTHFAFAIERWRARCGPAVLQWLSALGQVEALSSLAAYAYENPLDTFPTIVEGKPVFHATRLGHPLLPVATCVRNDVVLGENTRMLLVSGSNMSGKSTLLRAMGTNTVLALAGAPARAAEFKLSVLAIGATLRVQDSLGEGASRFYAEIVRLRQIVDLTGGAHSVLFLLDEILHGTNSHDRLAGAQGVIRGLLSRGAIGAVTTHDLALTRITTDIGEGMVENVYFEDHFENGKMFFDYVMRPGVITKSNALALMRSIGIEV